MDGDPGLERLTGALLDRLTHHVHILEMNGPSYRLQHSQLEQSKQRKINTNAGVDAKLQPSDSASVAEEDNTSESE